MKAFIYWSGGKDAAMAYMACKVLYGQYPDLLVTRVTNNNLVAAHETDVTLIKAQAAAMDKVLKTIVIPAFAPNSVYEEVFTALIHQLKQKQYTHAVFGDIFLEDLKTYHTGFHQKLGIDCLFPLWGSDTRLLGNSIIDAGIQARVAAVNTKYLPASFAGVEYNHHFLKQLPQEVDACGENGEYHTFVYNAPFFNSPVKIVPMGKLNKITYHAGTEYETEIAYIPMGLDEET